MKARIKGTIEWKEYKEVYGQHGEFCGLETAGYTQTYEEWCKEQGIEYDPTSPFRCDNYISKIIPLEAFDLWQEPDWSAFRREAAKDILAGMMQHKVLSDSYARFYIPIEKTVSAAMELADELIKQLQKEKK